MRSLGKLIIPLILLVAALAGYWFWKGSKLDAESRAYAETAIPAIFGHWNQQEVYNRASPGFQDALKKSDFANLITRFGQHYGPMVSYDGLTGESHISLHHNGLGKSAAYQALAKFQNGATHVEVDLVKLDGQWMLSGIQVHADSPAQ